MATADCQPRLAANCYIVLAWYMTADPRSLRFLMPNGGMASWLLDAQHFSCAEEAVAAWHAMPKDKLWNRPQLQHVETVVRGTTFVQPGARETLRKIHAQLDEQEWSADTSADIAQIPPGRGIHNHKTLGDDMSKNSIRRQRVTVEFLGPVHGPHVEDIGLLEALRRADTDDMVSSHVVLEDVVISGHDALKACTRLGTEPEFFDLDLTMRDREHDSSAIEAIHKILDGQGWSAATVPAIADILENIGLTIRDSNAAPPTLGNPLQEAVNTPREGPEPVMHLAFDLSLEQLTHLNDLVQGARTQAIADQGRLSSDSPSGAAGQTWVDGYPPLVRLTAIETAINDGLTQSYPSAP